MTATLLGPDTSPNWGAGVNRSGSPCVGAHTMRRIDSTHSIWIFDEERTRFRRLPHGSDPNALSLESDWQTYYALELDEETGAFTVALNEDGTRLLRAWREPARPADVTQELRTGEFTVETSDQG